jgi:hypothetical protein
MEKLIGRQAEKKLLNDAMKSGSPELIALFGGDGYRSLGYNAAEQILLEYQMTFHTVPELKKLDRRYF